MRRPPVLPAEQQPVILVVRPVLLALGVELVDQPGQRSERQGGPLRGPRPALPAPGSGRGGPPGAPAPSQPSDAIDLAGSFDGGSVWQGDRLPALEGPVRSRRVKGVYGVAVQSAAPTHDHP